MILGGIQYLLLHLSIIGLLSVSICILGSPENLPVPQQQYNTSGPILLKLKVMFFSINILNMILLKLDF